MVPPLTLVQHHWVTLYFEWLLDWVNNSLKKQKQKKGEAMQKRPKKYWLCWERKRLFRCIKFILLFLFYIWFCVLKIQFDQRSLEKKSESRKDGLHNDVSLNFLKWIKIYFHSFTYKRTNTVSYEIIFIFFLDWCHHQIH